MSLLRVLLPLRRLPRLRESEFSGLLLVADAIVVVARLLLILLIMLLALISFSKPHRQSIRPMFSLAGILTRFCCHGKTILSPLLPPSFQNRCAMPRRDGASYYQSIISRAQRGSAAV